MRIMTRHNFYGWWMVFAGFIIIILGYVARHPQIIFKSLPEIGEPALSVAISASSIFGLLGLLLSAPIADRKGPRKPILAGITLMGVSLILLNFTTQPGIFYFLMALLGLGFGVALSIAPHTAIASWFSNRRSLALAVLVVAPRVGNGLAGVVKDVFHHDQQLLIMGLSLLAIGLPLSFFIKNKHHASESGYHFTLREALKNSSFWLLTIAMAISYLALFTQPRLLIAAFVSPQQFINFTTILTLSSIAGVLLFGFMGDIFPKRFLLAASAISLGIGSSISLVIAGSWQVYLYAVFFGLGYGLYPLMFAIRADYFGLENFATISAVMMAIIEIGFVGIAFAVSKLAFTQREPGLTILSIVLSFIAAILFYFAKFPTFKD